MKEKITSLVLVLVVAMSMTVGASAASYIDLHDEVNDYNSIRSIIPCQGVSAVYLDDDGDSEICPCAFVMLMSDGKIEPFVFATDKDIERIANKGHTGFTGFVPTK